jgi:hypothetical protein
MFKTALLLFLLLFVGCTSSPPISENLPLKIHSWESGHGISLRKHDIVLDNKYAILMNSNLFDHNGEFIPDQYVKTDMTQIARLLTHKGYLVIHIEHVDDLYKVLKILSRVSDEDTKVFFAYSGKGDSKGLRLRGRYISELKRMLIIPPNQTIGPRKLIDSLQLIRGQKAVLLNACESGVFSDYAKKANFGFDGIVMAACGVGEETTPYEPDNTTAIYSTFLRHYSDDVDKVYNLPDMDMDSVGGWWNNLLHHVFGKSSKLKLSYNTVIYSKGNFRL